MLIKIDLPTQETVNILLAQETADILTDSHTDIHKRTRTHKKYAEGYIMTFTRTHMIWKKKTKQRYN